MKTLFLIMNGLYIAVSLLLYIDSYFVLKITRNDDLMGKAICIEFVKKSYWKNEMASYRLLRY